MFKAWVTQYVTALQLQQNSAKGFPLGLWTLLLQATSDDAHTMAISAGARRATAVPFARSAGAGGGATQGAAMPHG